MIAIFYKHQEVLLEMLHRILKSKNIELVSGRFFDQLNQKINLKQSIQKSTTNHN